MGVTGNGDSGCKMAEDVDLRQMSFFAIGRLFFKPSSYYTSSITE